MSTARGPQTRKAPNKGRKGGGALASAAKRARKEIGSGAWVGRIGIGLFLIGIAFLFKYTIEREWITPEVRVALGVILALVLVGMGLRLASRRRGFSHVLIGGGIATLFVTAYAAYELYSMVPYPLALAALALGTVSCYVISVRLKGAVLALVAALGGLGTPFILVSGEGTALGLSIYISLVIAAAVGVFMYGGWRSLIWTAGVGGFIALQVGRANLPLVDAELALAQQAPLQGAFIFCFLAAGIIPLLRHFWHIREPDRWPVPALRVRWQFVKRPDLVMTVISAWVLATVTWSLWNWPETAWLVVGTMFSVGYAFASGILRRRGLTHAASAHAVASAAVILLVSSQLAEALWAWLLTAALVMTALHYASRLTGSRAMEAFGLFLGMVVTMMLSGRLSGADGAVSGILDGLGMADLAVVASFVASTWALRLRWQRVVFRIIAFIGAFWWIYRAFAMEDNGQGVHYDCLGILCAGLLSSWVDTP